MTKSLRLGALLLLSTTALGLAIAAAPVHADGTRERGRVVSDDADTGRVKLAGEHRQRHHDRHRRHHDDDHEDDDGQAGPSAPRAAAPGAPVPDNGLFRGTSRPKVDVQ